MSFPAHHFIGIGGVGMSAIAQVLHEQGQRVSGSDQAESATSRRLANLGIPVFVGHRPENLGTSEVVVVSTAVAETNPELAAARERGLIVKHRSQVLAEIMAAKRSIAVTGTHGKTTTTGMIASVLLAGDLDPTVLVGGHLPAIGGTARTGKGEFLVAEADESDKSIRRLSAEFVVLTNLEGDHLEHYRDLEEIGEVMLEFLNALPAHAQVVACVDDAGVRAILPRIQRPVATYGFSELADHQLSGMALSGEGSRFMLDQDAFALRVPGAHNVSNAAAAVVIGLLVGLDAATIAAGLDHFSGVGRRFQVMGTAGGVTVIDDYAHHPSEIRATLEAARLLERPIWAIFQPHRYTRTRALLAEFASAFGDIRGVGVLDIYSAGEAPNGVTSAVLVERMREANPGAAAFHWPDLATASKEVLARVAPGDLVLLMGAGNVYQLASPVLAALEAAVASQAVVGSAG